MIPAGEMGTVVEVRNGVNAYTDGVTVEFLRAPSPRIAVSLGLDPNRREPFRCLFPHSAVARMLARA
jgi:hypothetical protein